MRNTGEFTFSVQSGIGTNGQPWTRTPYVQNKFHPEDEFRTTEEIQQDCKELEANCAQLEAEIGRFG